jgi:hypothetical protein
MGGALNVPIHLHEVRQRSNFTFKTELVNISIKLVVCRKGFVEA